VRGRGISEDDSASSRKIAVINEAFARKFFQNEDPIGEHFGTEADNSRQYEVVGIAQDARYLTLDKPDGAFFFLPEAQADYSQTNLGSLFLHDIVILIRPGARLSEAQVRQAMASVDPSLPIISVRTLREKVAIELTQQQLIARLTSLFGLLSLLLASIGLYGSTAYNVGRRTGEIGVRMALGASRGQIVRLVLRGAFLLIAFGLILGIPLSLATSRILSSQLYGLSPYDAVPIATAAGVLGLFGLIATILPAQRAMRVDPMVALRHE
jgi:ABC-type antimicrobial peptide transport system permease subunit